MACLIALIIFGIMGIFSASHRALAKEAFICVFKRVTFRPCDTGFKEKIKGKISRNLTHDEWNKYVGSDIKYEKTISSLP